jgi:hypothetical protein
MASIFGKALYSHGQWSEVWKAKDGLNKAMEVASLGGDLLDHPEILKGALQAARAKAERLLQTLGVVSDTLEEGLRSRDETEDNEGE